MVLTMLPQEGLHSLAAEDSTVTTTDPVVTEDSQPAESETPDISEDTPETDPVVDVSDNPVQILHDGTPITQLFLYYMDRETLTAQAQGWEGAAYQWQLLLDIQTNLWVNIYDKTSAQCELSYALLCNALDEADSTYIRCRITRGEELTYSDPVCLVVNYNAPAQDDTHPSEDETIEMELVSDMVVIGQEETEEETSAEETTAEETTAEETTAEETTAEETTAKETTTEETSEEETSESQSTEASSEEETSESESMEETSEEETSAESEAASSEEETSSSEIDSTEEESTEAESETEITPEDSTEDIEAKMTEEESTEESVEQTEEESSAADETSETDETVTTLMESVSMGQYQDPVPLDDAPEYVTITIMYLDEQSLVTGVDTPLYNPYVARIKSGTEFGTSSRPVEVLSPTFLGFAPYFNSNETPNSSGEQWIDSDPASATHDNDASSVSIVLSAAETTHDHVYKVYYTPIDVKFSIRYFFQNTTDDMYTEDFSLFYTGSAKTGTIISEELISLHDGDGDPNKSPKGFFKTYHIPESVAADGSTVFEIYYDRLYYLIQFDNNGGFGVDPIYARYDTNFIINDPIQYGYNFKGWDLVATDDPNNTITLGDGVKDDIPSRMTGYNMSYKAIWEIIDTTYTIVYWVDNGDGTYTHLGQRVAAAKSATRVNGPNNDLTKDMLLCGLEEHTHTAACDQFKCGYTVHVHTDACYNCSAHVHVATCYCGKTEHAANEHTIECYTDQSPTPADDATGNIENAFYNLSNYSVRNPVPGTVYRYRYRISNNNSITYNFFYCDQWYYLGSGEDDDNIDHSASNPTGNYTYTSSTASTRCHKHTDGDTCILCGFTEDHTHTPACLTCTIMSDHTHTEDCLACIAHTHSNDCKVDTTRLQFKSAQQNVLVEGDGSTVVNVYYEYQLYTLRFYYAKKENNKFYVVGGTTYPFGTYNYDLTYPDKTTDKTPVSELLSKVSQWGEVAAEPTINTAYRSNYTIATETVGSITYYYLEFSARYKSYIGDKWPIGIFDSVKVAQRTAQASTLEYAYFSAWNGEFGVKYTQDNSCHYGTNSKNETIKGRYMYLDDSLLIDIAKGYTDKDTVSFLGFWDNGYANGSSSFWSIPRLYRYHLMVATIGNTPYADKDITGTEETPNDKNLWIDHATFVTFDNSGFHEPHNQTPSALQGFTYVGYSLTKIPSGTVVDGVEQNIINDSYYGACDFYFYYHRQNYHLTVVNYNTTLFTKEVPFGTLFKDISELPAEPPYPNVLEQNAYEFDGWYTTAECYDYTKIDPATDTMEAYDMVLYAKWKPKVHTVNFFKTLADLQAYQADPTQTGLIYKTYTDITHGHVVGSVEQPTHTDHDVPLIFGGWFYLDNGQKKAFTTLSMPVNKDLMVFADWGSTSPQPYRVTYVLDKDGTTEVAAVTQGYAYCGSTRTFMAKAGDPYNQLFTEYNQGYFPTVSSHSITIQYEPDDDNPVSNIYTFRYVHAENVTYTIQHINKETNAVMETETFTTNAAVVTGRFKAFTGMVPDAFYKRLVIAVEKDAHGNWVGSSDNVIKFYYTTNATSAFYAVHYMLEKLDTPATSLDQYYIDGTGGYEETTIYTEGTGTIGNKVTVAPLAIPGFSAIIDNGIAQYKTGSSVPKTGTPINAVSGQYTITVTAEGTELYIFYRRNTYDYIVHYYEYPGTDAKKLAEHVTGEAKYGSQISLDALEIPGYTLQTVTPFVMTIRDDILQNTHAFLYSPLKYEIDYVVVPMEGGSLDITKEVKTGADTIDGCTPTANMYYEFAGWFTDEECTTPVDENIATVDLATNQLVPIKEKLDPTEINFFYAKFDLQAANLTIYRDNRGYIDSFVYEVKNTATGHVIYVDINRTDSVTIYGLPLGEYTITQQNGWSWRYGDGSQTVDHNGLDPDGTKVRFEGSRRSDWLGGNHNPDVANPSGAYNPSGAAE